MAVKHKNFDVVDWIVENGGKESLRVLNAAGSCNQNQFLDDRLCSAGVKIVTHSARRRAGLTPFTLTCSLGFVDMFNHILEKHMRQVGQSCFFEPRP
jgi:hypothetical protein